MMSDELSDEKMAIYRAAARKRRQQQQEKLVQRHQLAWKVARQAAELLKKHFGAQKVVLFGSMLSLERIHEHSDLDLAVWGLNPKDYYRAVGQLQGLESTLSVDLINVELAQPRILATLEKEGILL